MKLIFAACLFLSSQAFAAATTVQMKSISYDPKVVEIKTGDSVIWKNGSFTEHSATGDDFSTEMVKPKTESKPVVFAKAGSFDYHCKVHGKTMNGTVKVSAP